MQVRGKHGKLRISCEACIEETANRQDHHLQILSRLLACEILTAGLVTEINIFHCTVSRILENYRV